MKLNFLPKQEKFYAYLTQLTAVAQEGAQILKTYVEAQDMAGRKAAWQSLAECRAQSKTVMGEVTDELGRSFVTPFDREDIQNFCQYLYRIPKMIERVMQRMELHGLGTGRADFLRQIDVILQEAALMEAMVADLIHKRNAKQMMHNVALLHDLEQKGDDILQELLSSLFVESHDVKDLMLRKDIYDMLEKVIDRYRDAAAVTLQIVLKYS